MHETPFDASIIIRSAANAVEGAALLEDYVAERVAQDRAERASETVLGPRLVRWVAAEMACITGEGEG